MGDRRQLIAVITADSKGLDAGLTKAQRKQVRWAQKTGKEMRLSFKRGFGSATDLLGLGGAAAVLGAGKNVLDFQKRLVRLRIGARATKAEIGGLEAQVFKLAKQRGMDPEDVLGGAEVFVEKTGDLGKFTKGMDHLTKVAAATGAEMNDIGITAAAMTKSLGVAPEEWGMAFDVMARQGKEGSVELKNMAQELAGLAPKFRMFNKEGVSGMAELGALMQMSATGFSSASEAATGLNSLMGSLQKKATQLRAKGVNIFEKDGKTMKSLSKIIFDPKMQKLASQPVALTKTLGDKESIQALLAILKEGEATYKNLADEQKAVGTIQKDYDIWDESPAKKMASAQAKLSEFFNEEMKGHIEGIAKALEKVGDVMSFLAKHPFIVTLALLANKFGVMGPALERLVKLGGLSRGKKGFEFDKGQAGKAGAALGAFGVGYGIGTALDEWLGISDKISDGLFSILEGVDAADAAWKRRAANYDIAHAQGVKSGDRSLELNRFNAQAMTADQEAQRRRDEQSWTDLGWTDPEIANQEKIAAAARAKAAQTVRDADAAISGAMGATGANLDPQQQALLRTLALNKAGAAVARGTDTDATITANTQAELVKAIQALTRELKRGPSVGKKRGDDTDARRR